MYTNQKYNYENFKLNLMNDILELRKRIIYVIIGFAIVFFILFHFANDIYLLLAKPLLTYLPSGTKLIALDITAPFFVPLKLVAICAIVISLPNTILQIWLYIAPALYKHEQKILFFITIYAILLFILGIIFCYYIVLPTLFKFISYIKAADINMMTDINRYLDFVLSLFLTFGICFLLPVFIFLLIYFKIISSTKLKSLRPYIFVGCFIVAAILTPPDILSQIFLALPLYLLYEIGLFSVKFIN
jgi:sec-independent protein translocase protein TatC